jgi:hypothetical protein
VSKQQLIDLIDINSIIFVFQQLLSDGSTNVSNKQLLLKCFIQMCIVSEATRKMCIKQHLDKDVNSIKNDAKAVP